MTRTVADKTYTYDKNGNQITEVDSITGEQNIMNYDVANRLTGYTAKQNGQTVLTQTNAYNGEGQRIKKTETKGGKTKQNNYYYQDGTVLYTTDEEGERTSLNLMGTSGNVISTERTKDGISRVWYLYNKDIRESTSSLIDSSGAVSAAYEYDDFGQTTIRAGEDFDNEIGYTGQIMDKNTGLYYYNARHYDPENGRFLTQDTYRGEKEEPDALHLYTYCANNPINYMDPTGHFAAAVVVGGGIAIGTNVLIAAGVVIGVVVIGGIVWDAFKHKKGGKYKVKVEFHKPDRYNKKSGFAAMKARWKTGCKKGSSKWSKIKQFASHHRWRYHAHIKVYRNGKRIIKKDL